MDFYNRYEMLCAEHGLSAQSRQILELTGVTTDTISEWKKGVEPKASVAVRLARYFGVTVDYLLGVDNERSHDISRHEQLIVDAFRLVDAEGQQEIIYACRRELHRVQDGIPRQE